MIQFNIFFKEYECKYIQFDKKKANKNTNIFELAKKGKYKYKYKYLACFF